MNKYVGKFKMMAPFWKLNFPLALEFIKNIFNGKKASNFTVLRWVNKKVDVFNDFTFILTQELSQCKALNLVEFQRNKAKILELFTFS